MRSLAALTAVVALVAIAGSAGWVLTKDDTPRLSVSVKGVPGYVYYNRTYDVTIEYANYGGAVSGPVELSVQLPETFALAEHIDDPTRHGERVVWTLDGLGAGENGSVPLTVKGTTPIDLTNAVYDLPGYEGHTAFVEGFQLAVGLTAGDASAETLAVADTGVENGRIVVEKVCIGSQAGEFFEITLVPDETTSENPQVIGCGEFAIFDGLNGSGPFEAVETSTDEGYEQDEDASDCDDLQPGQAGHTDPDCQIVNNEVEEETGSIRIVKDTNPESSGITFDFDGDLGDIDLDDDESETFSDLPAGDYEVTENEEPGWNLVDIDCGSADVDVNLGAETVVIHLEAGDEVTCTFVNEEEEEEGTIIIEKDVNPEPDNTDFTFSDDIPGCSIGTLADDGAGGTPNVATCSGVSPGNYQVTELNPSPYVLVDIDCVDPDSGSSVGGSTASINLDSGETVRCVFVNRPPSQGSITISKDTNPETTGISFDFDGDLGDIDLDDNESVTFTDRASGTYVVTENLPPGWYLADIVCSGGDVTESANSVFIFLDPGEHISCQFVNQQVTVIPTPTKTPIVVPTATKTPVPTVGPVTPPSAGDGGLLDDGGLPWMFGVLSIVAAAATAWLFIQRMLRRSSRS